MKMILCLKLLAFSTLWASVLTLNAFRLNQQFYPTIVYMCKSNVCVATFYILGFVFAYAAGLIVQKVFFGRLRQSETDVLLERSWYGMTETCLAFTLFKDDLAHRFILMFTFLLFIKAYHWLAEERIDYMERTPVLSFLFYLRMLFLLLTLGFIDFYFVFSAYNSVVQTGLSAQLIFGFEYAILFISLANTFVRYLSHSRGLRENNWENQFYFVSYINLIVNFLKVLMYSVFIWVMYGDYSVPLFVVGPFLKTCYHLYMSGKNILNSRKAMNRLQRLCPDASPEDMMNEMCAICREGLVENAKKLPCGHIFHTACLTLWFQKQQKCPTCRYDIIKQGTVRIGQRRRRDVRRFRRTHEECFLRFRNGRYEVAANLTENDLNERMEFIRKTIKETEKSLRTLNRCYIALDTQVREMKKRRLRGVITNSLSSQTASTSVQD